MATNFLQGLIKKSVTFGTILTCADATVQLIEPHKQKQKCELNWKSLQRHGVIGSCIIGPLLYSYYFVVDKKLPGASTRTVLLKLACDCVFLNATYYCLFYYSLSLLEHKDHERAKYDTKNVLGKTCVIGALYWVPLQFYNFKYLSPQSRVVFIAMATYIEMNGLCLMSRVGAGKNQD